MKRVLAPLALTVVFVLGGCGGGDDPAPPAPPPEEPTGGNPPGTTPGDPGTTPTDPTTTPTTPTAPETPSAPTAPTAPTPSTPPSAPPTSTACAGLVPAEPGPGVEYQLQIGGTASCDAPVTDGRGEWIAVGSGLRFFNYRFVRADAPGTPIGNLNAPRPQYGGSPFAPQPDGYHVVRTAELPGSFFRHDAQGGMLAQGDRSDIWAIQGVPGGGSVVLRVEGLNDPDPAPPAYRLEWLDGSGARRAEAALPAGRADPAFVVNARGNVLAFSGDEARWYGRDGTPLTEWFFHAAGEQLHANVARAPTLADGSVVLGLGGPRPRLFAEGVAGTSAPPAWITARAGATIATVRGGRANAFAFLFSPEPCDARVEILTPAGESCGTTRLPASVCARVTFGADRTVFTTDESADGMCTWRWWTGLLR